MWQKPHVSDFHSKSTSYIINSLISSINVIIPGKGAAMSISINTLAYLVLGHVWQN